MDEPSRQSWSVLFGGLLEAINGADIDTGGDQSSLVRLLDDAKREGKLLEGPAGVGWSHRLDCDCMALHIVDADGEPLAVVPLHQLGSVGFVHNEEAENGTTTNILALKVGDTVQGEPDLADLLLVWAPSERVAEQICQHFVLCFQFLYREAIAAMEHVPELADQQQDGDLAKKFVPATDTSASASLCSSPICCPSQQHREEGEQPAMAANSTSTSSSNSTRQTVELINEYLTMLSACLSHDELNKFAILMRRWRSREIPILEFAQKLLELYGPERRHLLARMRSLLRGDPADLEALSDFLRANGVVENAAARSPPRTADMSLGGDLQQTASTASSSNSSSSNAQGVGGTTIGDKLIRPPPPNSSP